jgi:hypothetical protein
VIWDEWAWQNCVEEAGPARSSGLVFRKFSCVPDRHGNVWQFALLGKDVTIVRPQGKADVRKRKFEPMNIPLGENHGTKEH